MCQLSESQFKRRWIRLSDHKEHCQMNGSEYMGVSRAVKVGPQLLLASLKLKLWPKPLKTASNQHTKEPHNFVVCCIIFI